MYCQNCGAAVDAGAHFCAKCGQRVTSSAPPLAPPVAAAVAPASGAESPSPDTTDQFEPMRLKDVLFTTAGRLGRAKFLACYLSLVVLYVAVLLVGALLFPQASTQNVLGMATVVCIWPSIAIWVKRLQDMGYSGISLLILFVPIIGLIVVFAVFFVAGTRGPNKYGPSPNMRPVMVPQPSVSNWR